MVCAFYVLFRKSFSTLSYTCDIKLYLGLYFCDFHLPPTDFFFFLLSEVRCPMLFFFHLDSKLSQNLLLIYPTFSCPFPLLTLSHSEHRYMQRPFLWVPSFVHWPIYLMNYQYHTVFYKSPLTFLFKSVLYILVFGFLIFKLRNWY